MSISRIKGYNILIQGDMYKLPDNTYKTKHKRELSTLKLLTKINTTREYFPKNK